MPQRKAFVLMPFREPFNTYFPAIFKPALEAAGFTVTRADDNFTPWPVMLDIQQSICDADLILCEMSDRNPNVFYELGMSHAIGKPVVLVARKDEVIPFDLSHIRVIIYDSRVAGWEKALRRAVKAAAKASLASDEIWPPALISSKSTSKFLDHLSSAQIFEFKKKMEDAEQIDVLGYSCVNLLEQYPYEIAKAVARGANVRILMVKPNSSASQLMIEHTYAKPQKYDPQLVRERLKFIEQEIAKLPERKAGSLEVHYTTWIPSCGLTIVNRDSSNGELRVVIYPIRHATLRSSLIPHQIVSKRNDTIWFDYFVVQYNRLWDEDSIDISLVQEQGD